ncbi:MAG: sulfatase-like hydrolase/transferase [Hamadaea sp.]|nr:sulfatase-like hydrolase/transferase [Hamadaea sp.]
MSGVPEATRPNILLVNTDDQRWDTMRVMPKTMRWLKNGRTFDRATVSIPSCCPSRASLLTGQYPHNDNVRLQVDGPKIRTADTLPVILRKSGYKTAMAGKYLNSWPIDSPPPGFDHYSAMHGGYQGFKTFTDGKLQWVNAYSTTWYATKLRDWIREFDKSSSAPWFAYYTPYPPHPPSTPEPKYSSADVGSCVQKGEADVSDKPTWLTWTKYDAAVYDEICHKMLRTLLSMDDAMDTLLRDLDARGELKNTIVIYTSDNGYLWGEHNRTHKFVAYLPSVRVPLLMRWDGHVTAGADHRMAGHVDIMPTLLAAAGLPVPSRMDGRSLLGPARSGPIYSEYFYDTRNSKVPTWRSLWDGKLHYIENYDDAGRTTFRELYRTDTDPGELSNVLHGKVTDENRKLGDALRGKLSTARACKGSGCP